MLTKIDAMPQSSIFAWKQVKAESIIELFLVSALIFFPKMSTLIPLRLEEAGVFLSLVGAF